MKGMFGAYTFKDYLHASAKSVNQATVDLLQTIGICEIKRGSDIVAAPHVFLGV